MEQENLGTPFKEVVEEFKTYVEDLIIYNKLIFVKGASELSSILLMILVFSGLASFVLLFFSFAFAGWFGAITNLGIGSGYLVVALFYIILGIIVFTYRKKLIFNPSRKLFGDIFFGDINSDDDFKFDTSNSHTENIKKVHERLVERKETIDKKVKTIEENLTFANIFQEILGKAYNSIVSTSNIAKFAFSLIKSFKGMAGKKKRKSKRTKEINKGKNKD